MNSASRSPADVRVRQGLPIALGVLLVAQLLLALLIGPGEGRLDASAPTPRCCRSPWAGSIVSRSRVLRTGR
jgi:hypothetical protein